MRVDRRSFLSTAALGLAGSAVRRPAPVRSDGPNIVVVVTDDWGTDDAGCYGNSAIRTPGLDALAAAGTRFTHAFCTTASCSASRSVILSGLHNHRTGQYGHTHRFHHFVSFDDFPSLPVLLRAAGFRTVRTGKYHVAPETVYQFEDQIPAAGASPAAMADQCAPVFARADGRPFLLYFCTNEPHRPFERDGSDPFLPDQVEVPAYLPDIPETRAELARYYGSVQRADRGLLRLLEHLEASGCWDDTVVVFLSDNGIAFPGAKTTLYEPGMRLPFVMRRPDVRPGVSDIMLTWADLTPTLLDLADAMPVDATLHGRSFKEAMTGHTLEEWDEVFASHTFHEITMYYPMRVVRGRKYKLIWNLAHGLPYPFASDLWRSETWRGVVDRGLSHYGHRSIEAYLHRPRFELYDLEADPHEVHNLAASADHASILADYQARLRAYQAATDDPWISKWEYE